MKLSFHGADRAVTGSCHLMDCAGKRVLIDCGLYQGSREMHEENAEPFGFDPKSIDFLLLTHAHLDHCGRIPLLVKQGFRGEIVTTAASRELARLVMLDSGHLQEEEARRLARRAARRGAENKTVKPLYTALDALNSLDNFGRTATYGKSLKLGPASSPPSLTRAISWARRAFCSRSRKAAAVTMYCSQATSATPGGHCYAIR